MNLLQIIPDDNDNDMLVLDQNMILDNLERRERELASQSSGGSGGGSGGSGSAAATDYWRSTQTQDGSDDDDTDGFGGIPARSAHSVASSGVGQPKAGAGDAMDGYGGDDDDDDDDGGDGIGALPSRASHRSKGIIVASPRCCRARIAGTTMLTVWRYHRHACFAVMSHTQMLARSQLTS